MYFKAERPDIPANAVDKVMANGVLNSEWNIVLAGGTMRAIQTRSLPPATAASSRRDVPPPLLGRYSRPAQARLTCWASPVMARSAPVSPGAPRPGLGAGEDQQLLLVLAHRDHQPPAHRQLLLQWLGDLRRRGGHQDGVERRRLGPAP
jgi:hypothetical protein